MLRGPAGKASAPTSEESGSLPTPIGHSLAGLAVQLVAGKPLDRTRWWVSSLFLVALANLPDIDFVPGYLVGDPVRYHWGPAHSFGAAVLVGSIVAAVVVWRGGRFGPAFALSAAAYASHVVADMLLGPGPTLTGGLQAFWPLSGDRYMAPWSVFMLFPSSIDQIGPIRALFSSDIFPLIVREVLILAPVCVLAWSWRVIAGAGSGQLSPADQYDADPQT